MRRRKTRRFSRRQLILGAAGLCLLLIGIGEWFSGPIARGFTLEQEGLYRFTRGLPWCEDCEPPPGALQTLPPKKQNELRVLWIGETEVDGFVGLQGSPMRLLDGLLRDRGITLVTQVSVSRANWTSVDIEETIRSMPDIQADLAVVDLGLNDATGYGLRTRELRALGAPLIWLSADVLGQSALVYRVLRLLERKPGFSPFFVGEAEQKILKNDPRLRYFDVSASKILRDLSRLATHTLIIGQVFNEDDFDFPLMSVVQDPSTHDWAESLDAAARRGDRGEIEKLRNHSPTKPEDFVAFCQMAEEWGRFDLVTEYCHSDGSGIPFPTLWAQAINKIWLKKTQDRPDVSFLDPSDPVEALSPAKRPSTAGFYDAIHPNPRTQYIFASAVYQELNRRFANGRWPAPRPFEEAWKEISRTVDLSAVVERGISSHLIWSKFQFFKQAAEFYPQYRTRFLLGAAMMALKTRPSSSFERIMAELEKNPGRAEALHSLDLLEVSPSFDWDEASRSAIEKRLRPR